MAKFENPCLYDTINVSTCFCNVGFVLDGYGDFGVGLDNLFAYWFYCFD